MSGNGHELVRQARKFREAEKIEHPDVPNVGEALERWSKFLQDHETPSLNDCTHFVFDNFPDWWMGEKKHYRLAIAEDNTLGKLYKCISQLYDLGIPLTLQEKRTPEIRFVQDIEIWGLKDTTVQVEELMNAGSSFTKLLGKIMGEIYKKEPFLDAMVFDSTGYSRTKGVMKTSVRLVWSNIIVNRERAGRIRDYIAHKFKDSSDQEIRSLEAKIHGWNKDNQWGGVFGDHIYFGKHGVRMPLNDRVSPAPLKKPELRPFKPWGVLHFEYSEGENRELSKVEKLCGPEDLSGEEWCKVGCIRKDIGSQLTECELPSFRERASAAPREAAPPRNSGGHMPPTSVSSIAMTQRAPAEVRQRTHGGSDNNRPTIRRKEVDPQTERQVTVEREFEGTVEEFRERLESTIGKENTENEFEIEEGKLKWRSEEKNVRIQFTASTKRVYVIGTAHQVRSLLSAIAPIVKAVGESARSTTTARSVVSRGTSDYGAPSAVYTPSAVFMPSAIHAPSQVYSNASHTSAVREGGQAFENMVRIVTKAFAPEGQGELELAENDPVSIDHDPEAGQKNAHRWVYGTNGRTKTKGWFPYNHTKLVPLAADPTEEQ